MCLFVKDDATPILAEHDIVVYKVVNRAYNHETESFSKNEFCSPYQYSPYILGETKSSKLTKDCIDYDVSVCKAWFGDYFDEVTNGIPVIDDSIYIMGVEHGLHTFAAKEGADTYHNTRAYYNPDTCVILRCVIPAGSHYYKGWWVFGDLSMSSSDDDYKCVESYASTSLNVIEIV